jgi:hypothetical protein
MLLWNEKCLMFVKHPICCVAFNKNDLIHIITFLENRKPYHIKVVCMCVCVCERERERE